MNWESLAALGQVAGVVIGIPSVIYLAIQIRGQTRERQRAAIDSLTAEWGELVESLIEHPDFAEIWLRALINFDELDSVSKVRVSAFLTRFFKNFESMYYHRCDGTLDPAHWAEVERMMKDVITHPGAQQWWKTRKQWNTEEFAGVVDEIIARGQKPTMYVTYDLKHLATKGTDDGGKS
jgi:hypothetical protein